MLDNKKEGPINKNYLYGFLLGLFTFLVEIILLRQLSIFWGSGIAATAIVVFLFILGTGIGNMLSIKNFKIGHLIVLFCSIVLIILALSPQIVAYAASARAPAVYIITILVAMPGVFAGFFYAQIIKTFNKNKILTFILFDIIGSLIGCVLSFFALSVLGVSTILIATSFLLISLLLNKKTSLVITLAANLILVFILIGLSHPPAITPIPYNVTNATGQVAIPFSYYNENVIKNGSIFDEPSVYGQVIVNNGVLYVNGEYLCSNSSTDERTMSNIINSLVPNPKSVLVVGLGCGETLGQYVKDNNHTNITVVEINPVVVQAQKLFFNQSDNPVNNPHVKLIIGDGFQYLANSNQTYDLILIDVSNPEAVGSTQIYTQDFTKLLYSHLSSYGKIGWWNFFSYSEFGRVIYDTINSVFPYVILKTGNYSNLYFASKTEFYLNTTSQDANTMNMYASEPYIINTINKPVFK
jgi:spermidine synthase